MHCKGSCLYLVGHKRRIQLVPRVFGVRFFTSAFLSMSAGQLFHCRLLTDAGAIRTSHASSSHQSARLPAATLCLASDCSRASGAGLQVRRQSRTLTGITTHGPRTCSHRGLKAEPDGKETAASPETSTPADAEARLEALERGAKRGKGTEHITDAKSLLSACLVFLGVCPIRHALISSYIISPLGEQRSNDWH